MKINLILSATLLVIASAARVSADPTLKANSNPVIVPAGQTQSTKLYTTDKEQLLASVSMTVVVQQAAPTPTPSARPGRVGAGGRKEDTVVPVDSKGADRSSVTLMTKPVNNGQSFRLICRCGPELRVSLLSPFDNLSDGQPMRIVFNRSTQPPDPSGRNLQPGQCSPVDFQLRSLDPTQIHQEVDHHGEVVGSGRIIGSGQGDGEFFPGFPGDNLSLSAWERLGKYMEYLKDPKHYWTLLVNDVRDKDEHYFRMLNSEYWKPEFYKGPVVRPVDSKRTNKDNPYVLAPKKPK